MGMPAGRAEVSLVEGIGGQVVLWRCAENWHVAGWNDRFGGG